MNRIALNALNALTVIAAALTLPGVAAADFSHVEVRDVSGEALTPFALRTWRIYAIFTEPFEQALAVSGSEEVPLAFATDDPDGLFNEGAALGGSKEEDFAAFPLTAPWDSWVTIGHTANTGNDTGYTSGFLNNDGVTAVIVGASWSDDNDGWLDLETKAPTSGPEVVIAQFTVGRLHGVWLTGSIIYGDRGKPTIAPFSVSSPNVTCPSDFDRSGDVGFEDLLLLQSSWGVCAGPCPADLNGNGAVEFTDLFALLWAWGPCPQLGACCLAAGTCVRSIEPECVAALSPTRGP